MSETSTLPVITISREYGAGGRSVARRLAERLGVEYYDSDFVKLTSKVSGYSEEDVLREGENMSGYGRFINNFLNNTAAYISSYDAIYQAQKEVLLELAKKPCIIIGRCSNLILREEGIRTFDVFLYADRETRLKRTIEIGDCGKMDPGKYMDRRDNLRRTYYKAYTGHEMGDYHDYHICLDTGKAGIEKSVDILAEIVQSLKA